MKYLIRIYKVLFVCVLILHCGQCVKELNDKWTGCRFKEEYISVIGNIQRNITENGTNVVMVSNRHSNVTVRCVRQQEGKLTIIRGKEPQKGPKNLTERADRPGIYEAEIRLWKAQQNGFWDSEYDIECGNNADDSLCKLRVVEVQDDQDLDNKCEKDKKNKKVWCNITAWTNKASQKRDSGKCKDEDVNPSYKYYSYVTSNESWVDCPAYKDDGEPLSINDQSNRVTNTKFINCTISPEDGVKSQYVLIKMEKSIKEKPRLPPTTQKIKCKETSIFTIKFNLPESAKVSDKSSNEIMAKATYPIIGLLGTVLILILAVCCWKNKNYLLKKVTKKDSSSQGFTNTDSELANYIDSGPLILGAGNRGGKNKASLSDSITTISIEELDECKPNKDKLDVTDQAPVIKPEVPKTDTSITDDLNNQVTNRETIMKTMLEGNADKLNPDLPISQQAKLLRYNTTFEVKKKDFTINHIIGEGQFGSVFVGMAKGIYSPGDTKVAIKQVKDTLNDNQLTTIIDELKILSNLKMHINLVNLLGACTEDISLNEVYLLLEYCPFGDLKKFLLERRDKFLSTMRQSVGYMESPFNTKLLLGWCYNIAKGMEYLESKKIMHGDLAARNILVGENFVAKISDFGLSKQMYYNQDYKKTNRRLIPWAWMATEYLQTGEFNIKSDVWSFGVVLWEIFSLGNKPYGIETFEETKTKILSGYRLPCPDNMDLLDEGLDVYSLVMLPCWNYEASKRPTFKSLSSQLEEMYGEEGMAEYGELVEKYNKRERERDNKDNKEVETVPSGYVMVGHSESGEEVKREYISMKSAEANEGGGREEGGPPPGYILPSLGGDNGVSGRVGPPMGYIEPGSVGPPIGWDNTVNGVSGGVEPAGSVSPPLGYIEPGNVGLPIGYIPLESVRTQVEEGPSPGYSDIILQPGGYIGLSQVGQT